MATREELLILARLRNEASRPLQEVRRDVDAVVDKLSKAEKVTAAETRELRRLGAEANKTAREAKRLAREWQDVGERMTRFLTLPILAGMGGMTLAASNLHEQVSRSNVVFDRNGAVIQQWARTADEAMGLSTRAALQNAAGFGNMFTQMGIGLDRSTQMSQRLVELSADIASFANVSGGAAEVNETFAASFRGEYDSVQRFIPTIRAATVEQRAMQMGLADANGEISDQAKALATYQLLIEGAGAATGDFARTQDSAANRMRQAQAAIENAAAELGEDLLPVVAQGAGFVADLANALAALPGPAQTGILAVLGLAAIAGPIVFTIGKVRELKLWLDSSAVSATRLSAAMGSVGTASARVGLTGARVAGGITAVLAAYAGVEHFAGQREGRARNWIDDLLGENPLASAEDHARAITTVEAQLAHLERSEGRGRLFSIGGMNVFNTNANADAQERIDQLRDRLEDLQTSERELTREERRLRHAQNDTVEGLSDSERGALDAAFAYDELRQSIADSGDEYDRLIGRFVSLEQTRLRQREAIAEFRRQALIEGVSRSEELGFALDQVEATRRQVELEQEAGEIAEGRVAAYERQLELIGRIIAAMPQLAEEFAPTLEILRNEIRIGRAAGGASVIPKVGDRATPVGHLVNAGGLASTMAAHDAIDAMVPGQRTITSAVRNWGLGSPDSDHPKGRALDVVGSNLAGYAAAVRRMGGIAEMHGDSSNRHLHVVPAAPHRRGDTAIINVDARGASDPAAVERAGYRGAKRALRERDIRLRERN